jgi:hypothetical protein
MNTIYVKDPIDALEYENYPFTHDKLTIRAYFERLRIIADRHLSDMAPSPKN